MLELAPRERIPQGKFEGPGTAATSDDRRRRVLLLAGCAQQVLRPEINDATIRLLASNGVDVVVPPGAGCCGALVHHMGKEAAAVAQAKQNIDAWSKVIERERIDAVVINASGCGTMVKDYGHLLRLDPDYADRAATISGLTLDITEFLTRFDLGAPRRWSSLRIAYHSACSMQHGQRITSEPRALLRKAGFTLLEPPEGHICCGSAGVYNILQPELAGELRARKVANIESVRPDIVAAGNLGCITQIGLGTHLPVVHTVELLDWAYGGPVPRGLERFKGFVSDVPGDAAA
jgi:glycolate oxidase iron-sulfur subunit